MTHEPLPVGTRVRVARYVSGESNSPLSPAERGRISDGTGVTGVITGDDCVATHHGYAVHLDVPGSAIPRRAFIPTNWVERMDGALDTRLVMGLALRERWLKEAHYAPTQSHCDAILADLAVLDGLLAMANEAEAR